MAAPASAPALLPRSADALLDIVERAFHAKASEWLFFRELRIGAGQRTGAAQRLDAFALNTLPHLAMKRVCYEAKISRADFLSEFKQPLKRRAGMRYSNEFYFVTPGGMLDPSEVPVECGLIEAGHAQPEEYQCLLKRQAGGFAFDLEQRTYCIVTIPAPWRDTPGPTWDLTAAMLRNQRRSFEEKPPARPAQHRLAFS